MLERISVNANCYDVGWLEGVYACIIPVGLLESKSTVLSINTAPQRAIVIPVPNPAESANNAGAASISVASNSL